MEANSMANQVFKSPLEQANDIIDLDNRSLDITSDVDSFFGKYPKNEGETFDEYDERVYSPFANQYGSFLQREALNNIYDAALKKAYFGESIDADYERGAGPIDTPEKYQAYLKWKKGGK